MWIERAAAPKAKLIDPYFLKNDARATFEPDHALFDEAIERLALEGQDGVRRINYAAAGDRERALVADYLAYLQSIDPATLNRDAQFAFWANLYNAATIRAVLAGYPVKSIRDIEDVWSTPVARIRGRALSLNDIEHGVMRPVYKTPLVHYALNCASIGCPNLPQRALRGAGLAETLEAAAADYVNHPRGASLVRGDLIVSKIYGWFEDDFGGERGVLEHLRAYARPPLASALAGRGKVNGYSYDWSLNAP